MKASELFDLSGRVGLVTGASSGLGLRFAEVLAENGAAVALVARRKERLAALQAKIEAAGGRAVAIEADVLDSASMRRAFDAAEAAFGTVTILVNNAGVAHSTRAVDLAEAEWRRVLGTNLDAVFYWSQEAARRMLAAGKQGAIVNIASVLGFGVGKGVIAYAAGQGRRGAGHQGARPRARLQGHPRQRHRAGLVRHRDQPRLSRERGGQEAHPRHSGRPLRRATATSTARCCCSRPMPDVSSPAQRSWSTAARWSRSKDKSSWTSRCRPRSKTCACAPAPSSRRTCCRSNAILRISPSTRTFRANGSNRCGKTAKAAGLWAPQSPQGVRRHGAADRRLGGDVRGSRALAVRAARVQLHGARRRQHEPARPRRHAGPEGALAAPDRRGQGALVLRHDRAGARRRLRSRHDPHPRRTQRTANGSSTAASGSSPAPTARRISSSSRAPPTMRAAA